MNEPTFEEKEKIIDDIIEKHGIHPNEIGFKFITKSKLKAALSFEPAISFVDFCLMLESSKNFKLQKGKNGVEYVIKVVLD